MEEIQGNPIQEPDNSTNTQLSQSKGDIPTNALRENNKTKLFAILLFISFLIIILLYFSVLSKQAISPLKNKILQKSNQQTSSSLTQNGTKISESEKKLIDAWIEKKNLNEFGDPKGTVYTGGTPLFNETSGQTMDKYDYILHYHPDRPWNKK